MPRRNSNARQRYVPRTFSNEGSTQVEGSGVALIDVFNSRQVTKMVLGRIEVTDRSKGFKAVASQIIRKWSIPEVASTASNFWLRGSDEAKRGAFYQRHASGLPTLAYCALSQCMSTGGITGNLFDPTLQDATRYTAEQLLEAVNGDLDAAKVLDGPVPYRVVKNEEGWDWCRQGSIQPAHIRLSDYKYASLTAHGLAVR